MSQIKRIYQSTDLTQHVVPIKTVEQFKGFYVKFKNSATDAGVTATKGTFGRLTYRKRGVTLVDANIDLLWHYVSLLYGTLHFTAGAAAATELMLYVPRRFGDNNVETVTPADQATITITPTAAFAAQFDDNGGTFEVYLDCEQGVQKYDMTMKQITESWSAAGEFAMTLSHDNILSICMGHTDTGELTAIAGSTITRITTEVADQFRGDGDLDSYIWHTMNSFRHESATEPYVLVPFYAGGDVSSRLGDSAELSIAVSAADIHEILVTGAYFDPDRTRKTAEVQQQRLATTLTRKKASGKSNTVDAVRAMAK